MSDAADRQLPALVDPAFEALVPAIVADTHENAAERFLEYFAATIRNPNTRAAYMNAVADSWAEHQDDARYELAEPWEYPDEPPQLDEAAYFDPADLN